MELIYMQHVLRVGCTCRTIQTIERVPFQILFLIHWIESRRNLYIELESFHCGNLYQIYRRHSIIFIPECWYNILWNTIYMFYYNNKMDMNKSITKEIMRLVNVSKHVGWGILNDHVLRAHRVLWPLESHGVAILKRNISRTTISISAIWMKVEVSFKPFFLRSFAC
jgi:hypothetical protein